MAGNDLYMGGRRTTLNHTAIYLTTELGFLLQNTKITFVYFIFTLWHLNGVCCWHIWLLKTTFRLSHRKNHDCRCLGEARGRATNSHVIDIVLSAYLMFNANILTASFGRHLYIVYSFKPFSIYTNEAIGLYGFQIKGWGFRLFTTIVISVGTIIWHVNT